MIEIIYNESEKDGSSVVIKPPKNIRQIGSPKGRHKIYVEDYVYTFLHSAVFEKESQRRAAILLGKSEASRDIQYTFISGAVSCGEFIFQEEGIVFNEDCWEYIYKEIKQYFDGQDIVGWFLERTGFPLELTGAMEASHRKYFSGRDKVLFLSEPAEGEDIFFVHEQGNLQKKEGYYIYYEKNIAMQEYMVCTRERMQKPGNGIDARLLDDSGEQPGDCRQVESAIQNYRTMFQQKKEVSAGRRMSMFLYTSAAAAMVILCVIGVTTMNNYEKMQQVEETLAAFSGIGQKGKAEGGKEEDAEVPVESVPGEVTAQQPQSQQPYGQDGQTEPQQPSGQDGQTEPRQPSGQDGQTNPLKPTTENGTENIPGAESTTGEVSASARTYLEQGYYMVQAGDKLELICKNIYQTLDMMDKLCEINGIEDVDKIYEGQKLILP